MMLGAYLERTGETMKDFAQRSGVPISTISKICQEDGGTRTATAVRVFKATGGMVRYEDLTGNDTGTDRPNQ